MGGQIFIQFCRLRLVLETRREEISFMKEQVAEAWRQYLLREKVNEGTEEIQT